MCPLRRIFSISAGDLRWILSSPKLIVIAAGSFRRPCFAAMAVDHAQNLRRHLFHRLVGIHLHQPLLLLVVIHHRPRCFS